MKVLWGSENQIFHCLPLLQSQGYDSFEILDFMANTARENDSDSEQVTLIHRIYQEKGIVKPLLTPNGEPLAHREIENYASEVKSIDDFDCIRVVNGISSENCHELCSKCMFCHEVSTDPAPTPSTTFADVDTKDISDQLAPQFSFSNTDVFCIFDDPFSDAFNEVCSPIVPNEPSEPDFFTEIADSKSKQASAQISFFDMLDAANEVSPYKEEPEEVTEEPSDSTDECVTEATDSIDGEIVSDEETPIIEEVKESEEIDYSEQEFSCDDVFGFNPTVKDIIYCTDDKRLANKDVFYIGPDDSKTHFFYMEERNDKSVLKPFIYPASKSFFPGIFPIIEKRDDIFECNDCHSKDFILLDMNAKHAKYIVAQTAIYNNKLGILLYVEENLYFCSYHSNAHALLHWIFAKETLPIICIDSTMLATYVYRNDNCYDKVFSLFELSKVFRQDNNIESDPLWREINYPSINETNLLIRLLKKSYEIFGTYENDTQRTKRNLELEHYFNIANVLSFDVPYFVDGAGIDFENLSDIIFSYGAFSSKGEPGCILHLSGYESASGSSAMPAYKFAVGRLAKNHDLIRYHTKLLALDATGIYLYTPNEYKEALHETLINLSSVVIRNSKDLLSKTVVEEIAITSM